MKVSRIVCPACKTYLGLASSGATDCPRCAAPLTIASPDPQPCCPTTETPADSRDLLHGGLWLFGGIAVTTMTYLFAEAQGGGRYIVAWGAMFFGGIQFLHGLLAWARK